MRLTTRTNLAMRTLMLCAAHPDRLIRKHEVAVACDASENHLAQVIHLLGQQGFLETRRGRGGGVRLARPAHAITVGEVFRTFEAVLPLTDCLDKAPNTSICTMAGMCRLTSVLGEAVEAFYARLDKVTLNHLVAGNVPLAALLRVA